MLSAPCASPRNPRPATIFFFLTFSINITKVEQKLELIIDQLKKSDVEGKEELIDQLRDEELKTDKKKLRTVLGKVLSRAAEIGTIGSIIASLL